MDVALARPVQVARRDGEKTRIVVSPVPTQPGVTQAADPSAEIRQLRARLAESGDVLVKKRPVPSLFLRPMSLRRIRA